MVNSDLVFIQNIVFFNIYMFVTWIFKNRCGVDFNRWQGHLSDGADFEHPITIKIRSKKEIIHLYTKNGVEVKNYYKRGGGQNYIPLLGKLFKPNGLFLSFCGTILGWYHVIIFKPVKR